MKTNVHYTMCDDLRNIIITYRDAILEDFPNAFIYLFGSIAKGGFKKSSDIDLLVILPNQTLDVKERKDARILIGCNRPLLDRDLDCKVYGEFDFNDLSNTSNFERCIKNDLIDIGGWD